MAFSTHPQTCLVFAKRRREKGLKRALASRPAFPAPARPSPGLFRLNPGVAWCDLGARAGLSNDINAEHSLDQGVRALRYGTVSGRYRMFCEAAALGCRIDIAINA